MVSRSVREIREFNLAELCELCKFAQSSAPVLLQSIRNTIKSHTAQVWYPLAGQRSPLQDQARSVETLVKLLDDLLDGCVIQRLSTQENPSLPQRYRVTTLTTKNVNSRLLKGNACPFLHKKNRKK